MKTTQFLAAGLTAGALTFVSCTPTQQQYGLGGAAAGAAVGALAGGDSEDVLKGAALGGAAGTGYAVYRERQQNNNSRPVYNTPPPPTPQVNTQDYPAGYITETPGIVISPYEPNNKVNVKGFKPGQLAKDPTTGKIFVVPN